MNTSILILFISYFPPLYFSFNSLAMTLILIFFICNKEPDDAFGTHKVIYYLKKAPRKLLPIHLWGKLLCVLHSTAICIQKLFACVGLFGCMAHQFHICSFIGFQWVSSYFCCPSIVQHWCGKSSLYSAVN